MILRHGDNGNDVRALQLHLAAHGFPSGIIDGDFGPKTEAAVRSFQASRGLAVDGVVGPATWNAVLRAPVAKPTADVVDGWLTFAEHMPMHPSWRYDRLNTPGSRPLAIVAHYTATAPRTGVAMARNRMRPWTKSDRQASWHVTIETDGSVIQMAPLTVGCWHAGSSTALPIPGVGWANRTSVGIELVSKDGKAFPPAQVEAACRVWRAIVKAYDISRPFAMVTHQSIDPGRKSDPGPLWMVKYAPVVLEAAFG